MFNISEEKLDLSQRTLEVPWSDIFPKLNQRQILERFSTLKERFTEPHELLFEVAKDLALGGYDWVLSTQGFYEKGNEQYSGHCHQSTPVLGLVLDTLGFRNVVYLECYRIRNDFSQTGISEKVPPEEEQSTLRNEFITLRRIPYCVLEVAINGKRLISGKHLKAVADEASALLTPTCYENFIGVFPHQSDNTRSGIYLETVNPISNPKGQDRGKYPVWKKQALGKDPLPELFATYLRMEMK